MQQHEGIEGGRKYGHYKRTSVLQQGRNTALCKPTHSLTTFSFSELFVRSMLLCPTVVQERAFHRGMNAGLGWLFYSLPTTLGVVLSVFWLSRLLCSCGRGAPPPWHRAPCLKHGTCCWWLHFAFLSCWSCPFCLLLVPLPGQSEVSCVPRSFLCVCTHSALGWERRFSPLVRNLVKKMEGYGIIWTKVHVHNALVERLMEGLLS